MSSTPIHSSLRLALLSFPRCSRATRAPTANHDGRINADDVGFVSSCLGAPLPAEVACLSADTDDDGRIDQADVDFVVAALVIPSLPELASSDPASGAAAVPRTAWLRLDFVDPVSLRSLRTIELRCGGAPIPFAAHRVTPRTLAIDPRADLPVASACEIGWPGPNGPVALTFASAAPGTAAEVHYDRVDRTALAPFPDDFLLVPDASTLTGQRVAVFVPDREEDVVNIFQSLIADTAALDGFSPLAMIAVEVSEAPELASLPMTVEASLDPFASIALFDMTVGSSGYGRRVAFQLHVRNDVVGSKPIAHTLVAFPSIPLAPGGRYGLVVTERALASPSRPFAASAFFRSAVADPVAGEEPSITAVRDVADDVVEVAAKSFPPIQRDDVALALRISVRSVGDIPNDVLAMREQVHAEAPPSVTIQSVGPGSSAAFVRGTWNAPNWRQGVFLARNPDGTPRVTRRDPVPFVLHLPEAAQFGAVPVALYQHGNPGSANEVLYQDDLVDAGFAVVGFTDALNRAFPDAQSQLTGIFGTLLYGRRLPDYWVHTYGEQVAFLRALETLAAHDFLPLGAPDGVPELDLQRPIVYRGVSHGSNNGQAFLAYAPEIRAAALLTGATRFAEILFHQDTTDPAGIGSLLDFISVQIPNVRAPDVWAGLSLFQMLFDQQDPQNHARFIRREPLAIDGTTQKASVLVVEGLEDSFIPRNATRSLAWQLGPIPHLGPVLEPVPYLKPVDGSVSGNVDADTTAAFVQYAPSGLSHLPPSPGCEFWSEGHYCGQIASGPQQIAFFLSALGAGPPVIESSAAPPP